ncbi:hypothetical protein BGZ68_005888 [Mortierella alpina]|nr:hypothetical protein BGZ68_005888 [Mortierella alpina]
MDNSVTEAATLKSNYDQAQDQVSMDDNATNVETESRTKRFRTPDSSDSEEDELTASLLAPWRKSGSLSRSRLSTSNSMSPVTHELSCQLDAAKPQTLTDRFKLSIYSDDESISMQSAAEDGELGLEVAMETDETQPASQSKQDVTFSRDMGTIPELQTEDELEEARQRVEALCRSYTIVSENLASASQLQEEEIVDMDLDKDNPQSALIIEGGKVAEVRTKKDDTHGALETNDQCIIPYLANTADTSPFERVKAIAQKIPPTPSMVVSRKFPSPPVQALQQPWQFPTSAYYSSPTAMPDPGYYVPYGPGYDSHQHYHCGFTEQQEYADTNSPTNWACVPYRQEQEDANYRLPIGGGRNSHTLTPSTDATVETPEPPFERLSSSESTPGPSSEPSSTASPERCAPPLFVPPLPPGPRPTMFIPPLPPGPRPPLFTPPLPQGPPPLSVPPLPLAASLTPASPSPSLHPSHNDTATSLNKSLVLTAPRIPVSPLTTPEPSSSDGTVKQPADKTMASASPPARFRQVLMNKFTLDQSKIKKMAEISKEMLKKQEQLITLHHRVLALP